MRSINPSCKLVGMIVLTLALAAARDPVANLAAFTFAIALMWQARVPFRTVLLCLAPLAVVAAGLFMTGYRFAGDASAPGRLGMWFDIDPDVANGILFATRVFAYAGLGFLFALTTDKMELVRSLRQQLQVPPIYAYALIAAWNILPDLEHEYRRTRRAFRARGLHPHPFSPALLRPMLLKSVMWSQSLAIAMESKGFDGRAARTEWRMPAVTRRDVLFLIVTVGGAAGLLAWS